MKEERMFILKMVQDGKITADEAVKLLESISPSQCINSIGKTRVMNIN